MGKKVKLDEFEIIDNLNEYKDTIKSLQVLLKVIEGDKADPLGRATLTKDEVDMLASVTKYSGVVASMQMMRISNLYEVVKEAENYKLSERLTGEEIQYLNRLFYREKSNDSLKISQYVINKNTQTGKLDIIAHNIMNSIRNASSHMKYSLGYKSNLQLDNLRESDIFIIIEVPIIDKSGNITTDKNKVVMPLQEFSKVVDIFESAISRKKTRAVDLTLRRQKVLKKGKEKEIIKIEKCKIIETYRDDKGEKNKKFVSEKNLSEKEKVFLENQINNLPAGLWNEIEAFHMEQEFFIQQLDYFNSCTIKIDNSGELGISKPADFMGTSDRTNGIIETFKPIHVDYITRLHEISKRLQSPYIKIPTTDKKPKPYGKGNNSEYKVGIEEVGYLTYIDESDRNVKGKINSLSTYVKTSENKYIDFFNKYKSMSPEDREKIWNGSFLSDFQSEEQIMLAQTAHRLRDEISAKSLRDLLYRKTAKTMLAYTCSSIVNAVETNRAGKTGYPQIVSTRFNPGYKIGKLAIIKHIKNAIIHARNEDKNQNYNKTKKLGDIEVQLIDVMDGNITYNHRISLRNCLQLVDDLKNVVISKGSTKKTEHVVSNYKSDGKTPTKAARTITKKSMLEKIRKMGINKSEFLKSNDEITLAIRSSKSTNARKKQQNKGTENIAEK